MSITNGKQFWDTWNQQVSTISDTYQQGKIWYDLWQRVHDVLSDAQSLDESIIAYWMSHKNDFSPHMEKYMLDVLLGDDINSPIMLHEAHVITYLIPWIEEKMEGWLSNPSLGLNPYYFIQNTYFNASLFAQSLMLTFLYDRKPDLFDEHPLEEHEDTLLHLYYQIFAQGDDAMPDADELEEWELFRVSKCQQFLQLHGACGGSFVDVLRLMAKPSQTHQEIALFMEGLDSC